MSTQLPQKILSPETFTLTWVADVDYTGPRATEIRQDGEEHICCLTLTLSIAFGETLWYISVGVAWQ